MGYKLNLNLNVYTAEEFPTTGSENDIVIVSDIPMKDWIMSPYPPVNPPRSEGDVWLQYSVSGKVQNATKNGSFLIAVNSAYQYVGGEWVSKEFKTYQDGAPVDNKLWLFKEGEGLADGYSLYQGSPAGDAYTITDGSLLWATSTDKGNTFNIEPAIDLTGYNTLVVDMQCYQRKDVNCKVTVGVGQSKVTNYYTPGDFAASVADFFDANRNEYRIDVRDLSGLHYVKLSGFATKGYIYNLWFE